MAQPGTVMAELDSLKAAMQLLGEEVAIFERELGKLTSPDVGTRSGNGSAPMHWRRRRAPASRLEVWRARFIRAPWRRTLRLKS